MSPIICFVHEPKCTSWPQRKIDFARFSPTAPAPIWYPKPHSKRQPLFGPGKNVIRCHVGHFVSIDRSIELNEASTPMTATKIRVEDK